MQFLQFGSKISLATLFLAFALFGCSGDSGKKEKKTDMPKDKTEMKKAVKEIVYPLPTSFEVTNMLNKAGASYILNISNSVQNVDKYMTEKSRALNLGVYGADLSYASTYQQSNETMSYFKASKRLTDDLNISTSFNKELLNKIEANLNNKEELVNIVTNSFHDTYKYLNKNGKGNLSILVLTGTWVEGLYIASQLASTSKDKNDDIVKVIVSQKKVFNKLMKIMEKSKDNADIAEIHGELKTVHEILNATKDKMSKEQFDKFAKEIEKLRTKIVSLT